MALTLTSSAFTHGGAIPSHYTCDGQDISPPLSWQGVPPDTRALVLLVDDPDAPDPTAPKMTWVHWVVVNLPPDTLGLPENASAGALPAGVTEGINDWKQPGYRGPCPPIGRHRYFHKLYALDTPLKGIGKTPTKAVIETAMYGHILAQTELMGTYQKSK